MLGNLVLLSVLGRNIRNPNFISDQLSDCTRKVESHDCHW